MISNENDSEKSSSNPYNYGNLTKFIMPGLYFLLSKMERAVALCNAMAMLPDQIREGAEKAPELF